MKLSKNLRSGSAGDRHDCGRIQEDDNQLARLDEDERGQEKESEEEQMVRQLEEECQELALVDEVAVDEADVIDLVPVPPPAKNEANQHC